ncbi:copper resistance CopC family protein [Actinoplanes sp. NPDC051861]|uniref:copper resistance CopC family protein n=1 Tax=Actinoplanes sp. NPDC051861 TaxID=3155170 RepID=UPI003445D56B
MRRPLLPVVALLAVLTPSVPAWAHAVLVSADPAKNGVLVKAPGTVTLRFSERLNPDYTTIVISDASRQRVPAAPAVVEQSTGSVTLTGSLANGTYTVAYRVVSVDGHTVQGSYEFTLADPVLPAAAVPQASATGVPVSQASAAAAREESAGVPGGVLGGAVAAGLLLVAVGVWLVAGRRRRSAP